MKLHLNKSLRAALLVCVCSCVATTVQAAPEIAPEKWIVNPTPYLDGDGIQIANDYGVQLTESKDYGPLWMYDIGVVDVTEGVEASAMLDARGTIYKTGLGTVTAGEKPKWNRPRNIIVEAGTLIFAYGDEGTGVATNSIEVLGGAKVVLNVQDSLGYNDGATKTVTLDGDETADATLEINEHQTGTTNILMKGDTRLSGSGYLDGFDGTITATGTDNIISATLKTRKGLNLAVTDEADVLTITGTVEHTSVQGFDNNDLIKTGNGKLVLATGALVKSSSDVVINGGTVEIGNCIAWGQTGAGSAIVDGAILVNAGGTLLLSGDDALGYASGTATDSVTLTGSKTVTDIVDPETQEVTGTDETITRATMTIADEKLTLMTGINLNGHTLVQAGTNPGSVNSGNIEAFGGAITATGTDNTVSVDVHTRKAVTLEVTNAGDELTYSGNITRSTNQDFNQHSVTKTGEGTLILASSVQVANDVDLIIDEGTVRPDGNIDRSYILRGGTIELNNNRVGNDNGTTTGTITLAEETDGTTSENTIKSSGKPGAIFASVSGEGNLTLTGSVNVYSDMDYTGKLTMQSGEYNIGHNGYGDSPSIANDGNITIAADATAKVDAKSGNDATLIQNNGDITVNGTLEVAKGTVNNTGDIKVDGEAATLKVGSAATIISDIVVTNGATLDVSDSLTLGSGSINLGSDSTLIVANKTVNFSGALTLGENVTIDMSWCSADNFAPGINIFSGASNSDWIGTQVTIQLADNATIYGWLQLGADGTSVRLVPEPTTATLSLLALAGLCARRRRK